MIYIAMLLIVGFLFIIFFYFGTSKKNKQAALEKTKREREYQRVLSEAKKAERKDKIFKAQTGHVPTQLSLAKELEVLNKPEAIRWYLSAAEQENDIAQYSLVRLYSSDPYNTEYQQKAVYWQNYIKAKEGDASSKYQLGMMLLKGDGVEINLTKGIAFIEDAAKQGYIEAQLMMANWVVSESSALNDHRQSFYWYMKAAIQGDLKAQIHVANAYKSGDNITKSNEKASYWYERAAAQNDAMAQINAAQMSVSHDLHKASVAYIWYSLAYNNGLNEAKKPSEQMAMEIGLSSIVSVQSVAKKILSLSKSGHSIESIDLLDRLYNRVSYNPEQDPEYLSIVENRFLDSYVGETAKVLSNNATQESDMTPHSPRDLTDESLESLGADNEGRPIVYRS